MQARVEALDGDEDIVQVRQLHSQHYLLHKVTEPKFALPIPDEWYLNTEGGLPPREGLTVIADGTHGPVLLTYDNVLVLSAVVKQGRSYDMCRQILKNFLRGVITRLQVSLILQAHLRIRQEYRCRGCKSVFDGHHEQS